jgi:regulator of protease activity HflC (stomatin/prohibitin superfamily)
MIIETSDQKAVAATPARRGRWARLRASFARHAFGVLFTLFVLAFGFLYVSPGVFYTIGPGELGVLYLRFFGGTQTDRVVSEGFKVVPPWDRLYIYNVRVQERKHDMQVLSKEGISTTLHLSIRYHPEPELVGMLHERVGPEYADRIVVPEVESALRTIMGEFNLPQVYGSDRGLVQQAINDSLEKVSQKYVTVDSIVLRSVELPQKVKDAVEDKMAQMEVAESYRYKLDRENQEAERKRIEANGIKTYNDLLASSLSPSVLKWEAIQATKALVTSPNAKTIVVGTSSTSLPIMLNSDK